MTDGRSMDIEIMDDSSPWQLFPHLHKHQIRDLDGRIDFFSLLLI